MTPAGQKIKFRLVFFGFIIIILFLARIFHKDRREKLKRVVDTRRAEKNTRRHPVGMLRMLFKRNEVDACEIYGLSRTLRNF